MKTPVLVACLALAASAAPAQWTNSAPSAGEPPSILREIGFDQKLGEPLPLDAAFRDDAGRPVRLGDYFGAKPVVLNLVYYDCPMLCTVSLNGLAGALDVLSFTAGREFEIVTISFDPKETPKLAAAKKKAYLARYKRPGAEAGWHFLTGEREAIDRVTRAVGFRYAWDEQTRQFAHPAGLLVLTPQGRISHYLFGIEYAPKDLRLALVDAGGGGIGNAVDQVLLYCYQYDPTTGRYGASIMNIIRLGGGLIVLALVVFVLVMRRRERGAARPLPGRAV